MSLQPISPEAAHAMVAQGAVLVDIRAADEHARERIVGARNLPMDRLARGALADQGILPGQVSDAVIFHCRSGARTQLNAPVLAGCAPCRAYVLEGGLDAWKAAGLPVLADTSQPLELQRQVQIAAGSLVLLGAVLGATVSPWLHLLSAFVGAGLVFAGLSGFCGMALLLVRMPWNRRAAT